MSRTKMPHHMTTASIQLQKVDAHVGRTVRYRCGCDYHTSNASWTLCSYHDGYNDAWEEAIPEPDDAS